MLEDRKSLMILITTVSLGVCVFVVYILFNIDSHGVAKTEERPQFKGIFADREEKRAQTSYSEDFITPVVGALQESITSFFEENEVGEPVKVEPQETQNNNWVQNDSLKPLNAEISITEKQIFEFGYDKAHLGVLENFKNIMISQGFISQSDSYPLTNMQEAIKLQDKFADYIEARAALNKEELEKYRYAYRTLLPRLWEQEYRAMSSNSAKKFWYSFRANMIKKKIAELMAIIPEANAQGGCYREGINNMIRGSQRAAPCCNCTVNGIPIGCLNAVCARLPAIWDPVTHICACYI